MAAVVAFMPRELAVCVDGKRKDAWSVTPRARCRRMEEKRRNGMFERQGFLAQAMVRNPPCAGGSGQHGHCNTLPRDESGIRLYGDLLRSRNRAVGPKQLKTAAAAAAGTEFHSTRCHTHDIANTCRA